LPLNTPPASGDHGVMPRPSSRAWHQFTFDRSSSREY
jgi:hypothetical protein